MVEGGLVLVERITGKVQHTIVEVGILQDKLVDGLDGVRRLADALVHEHRVVQVALIDEPHVNEAENGNQPYRGQCLQLLGFVEQQEQRADDDDDERTPAVSREDWYAHLGQVVGNKTQHLRILDIA